MSDSESIKKNVLTNTYGLAVIGGNSRRMGTDKSLLQYHTKPQRYHVSDMLLPLCENVFISCNAAQADNLEAGYSFLTDLPQYNNIGPMAALLTAFTQFPNKNILMIGCDYPFLTVDNLQQFSDFCKDECKAVSFYNEKENKYEPLIAWYPYPCFKQLKLMHEAKQYSLQHFLKDTDAAKFYPSNKISIVSVDTYEAFNKAFNTINP